MMMTSSLIRIASIALLAWSFYSCAEQPQAENASKVTEMARVREQLQRQLGPKYDEPVPAATEAQLTRGKALFETLCATCHGPTGKPPAVVAATLVRPPADLSDPEVVNFYSEAARLQIIRDGIPGTPMNGWKGMLAEEDILAVFMYTQTLIRDQ